MKIRIAENIKALRKQHNFTQEQLAEALGVSVGAVYKWESGQSVPEVKLIMELADLFETSVDTLLGYDRQGGNIRHRIDRILQYAMEKDWKESTLEAEKALKKFPNSFEIVYTAATIYMLCFSDSSNERAMLRSNALFQDAISLLYQNQDKHINKATIHSQIARNYLHAGQTEKAIEILEQNNFGGINSALIGFNYSLIHQPDKAKPHLYRGYQNMLNGVLHTMAGMTFMFAQQEDPRCIDAALWLADFFDSLKEDASGITFTDRLKAILYGEIALTYAAFGNEALAVRYIEDAFRLAKKFDSAPLYNTRGLKFLEDDTPLLCSDGLGGTAMDGIENFVFGKARPSQALDFVRNRLEKLKNEKEG